jgi:hypothetical protein
MKRYADVTSHKWEAGFGNDFVSPENINDPFILGIKFKFSVFMNGFSERPIDREFTRAQFEKFLDLLDYGWNAELFQKYSRGKLSLSEFTNSFLAEYKRMTKLKEE